ncbi:MAG: hypothetical protein EZS28_006171 [Streblomastix strix]|uniref:Uncharacterized protein n=1 Tax=Streblomastix strix TaxID=222440 RepID=A0A5J4WUR1_9EUKA|nr:MAG: hypothetical protein EZS28_006171 [Streblomastix strix]
MINALTTNQLTSTIRANLSEIIAGDIEATQIKLSDSTDKQILLANGTAVDLGANVYKPIGGVSTLEYSWVITSQFDGTGTWLRDAPFQTQKDNDYKNIIKEINIDRDCITFKFNGQEIGTTSAKYGMFHAGYYTVGLSQGSLVLHSSGIVYIGAYLHWTSQGGLTNIPITVGYVDEEFIFIIIEEDIFGEIVANLIVPALGPVGGMTLKKLIQDHQPLIQSVEKDQNKR